MDNAMVPIIPSSSKVRVIIAGKKSKQDSIILKTFCREKGQAKICELPGAGEAKVEQL
jgi:hypothetical protein